MNNTLTNNNIATEDQLNIWNLFVQLDSNILFNPLISYHAIYSTQCSRARQQIEVH